MISEFYGTEIFLDNEATREYLDICRGALLRGDPGEYFEVHAVVPTWCWKALPWAVKGKLNEAMPKDKWVFCNLTPEEHYRCHQLFVEMFENSTIIRTAEHELRRRHSPSAREYGEKMRQLNSGRNWRERKEHLKYEAM